VSTAQWAMPAGQLVLPADAARDQWLAERRRGIGSSDIPVIMGVRDYGSEYELWLDKTGRAEAQEQTEAMRRGQWLEPHVVDYFAKKTGLAVRRCGLVAHRDRPVLRATPDRLTADGGALEVKTMGAWAQARAEWADGVARRAYIQGQFQLLVTGRKHCWFAGYAIDCEPMIRGPYPRDDELIEEMLDQAYQWWNSYVVADQPPPPDLATITDQEISLRWPTGAPGTTARAEWPAHVRRMLIERAEMKATEKEAKERASEIDKALKVMTGDAEALLVGERPVLTIKPAKTNASVDPALETDHPDIYARYVRRGTTRRIHIVKGWENA
jgi:putative phage-type endonuclease